LDDESATKMFGSANPIGKRMVFNNNSALVVGVLKKEESALGFNDGSTCYMPYSTFKTIYQWANIHELQGSAPDKDKVATALARSQKILDKRHNAPNGYGVTNMEAEMHRSIRLQVL
jgi:putative ABC transport system permease protein